MKFIDRIGQRFGKLVVIERTPNIIHTRSWVAFKCKCDCGTIKVVKSISLQNGSTQSCGCKAKGPRSNLSYKSEYHVWADMKQRCINPHNWAYRWYGGRGIKVCSQWLQSFKNFYSDMGPRPVNHTLERIDNNGNYEPNNCLWTTRKKQAQNRRKRGMLPSRNLRTGCFCK